MPKCSKCNEFLPPGFVDKVEGTEDSLCIFCKRDIKTMTYKGVSVKKETLIEEYKLALKMIKEKNEIIKNAARGIKPVGLPESVLM
jgi:glutaredoxin